MTTPLFSTYGQTENLVTSTFISVLQRLSLTNMDRILQALLQDITEEDEDFSLVTFTNQPIIPNQPKNGNLRADASIVPGFASIWIETKIARNDPGLRSQAKDYLKHLPDDARLLLLTPDDNAPLNLSDDKLIWSNFSVLSDAIEEILQHEDDPPSEKEAFLLRELNMMLNRLGLTFSPSDRVIVVAAADHAWDMYEQLSGYRRARNRTIKSSGYMAFYKDGEIKSRVPRIKSMVERINMTQQSEIEELCSREKEDAIELWEKIEKHGQQGEFNEDFMVFFLTGSNDSETIDLGKPIKNDKQSKNGKPVPFTYGNPRYVTLDSLKSASKTSDLKPC